MRILSKGSELPFVHKSVGWDESTNFKDYDIVFVNLRTLEDSAQDYDHPYNDSDESPEILDKSDVSTFIQEDGYMVAYLPNSPVAEMGDTTTEPKSKFSSQPVTARQRQVNKNKEVEPYCDYELLNWLPFSVNITTEESGKSIEFFEEEWKWYFGNLFSWDKIISVDSSTFYDADSIVENSYGERIATKISRSSGGHISLIPPDETTTYSDFVKNTLQNVFDVDIDVEGRAPPAWLSDYSLPNEEDIEDSIQEKKKEIEDLEKELESLTKFKKLLYETHTNLEEVTRDALREIGFTVDGEIPGKRDGILQTPEKRFTLEITGTTGGIKLSKCRQLDDWVENVTIEFPDEDVSGLLIVNSEMGTPPEERNISLEPNVERYMKRRGDYKILTTLDLYRLVEIDIEEGLDMNDVEELFYQDETLLTLPDKYKS